MSMRIRKKIQTVPRRIKLRIGLDMSENTEEIQSPCIGVCSIDDTTGFCHGCYRTKDEIKAWWNNRQETDVAWKIGIDEIKKRGYNLDIKNPNIVEVDELNPEEVLQDYRAKQAEVKEILEKIKAELTEALAHHDR